MRLIDEVFIFIPQLTFGLLILIGNPEMVESIVKVRQIRQLFKMSPDGTYEGEINFSVFHDCQLVGKLG
jgi:hypothetical protein